MVRRYGKYQIWDHKKKRYVTKELKRKYTDAQRAAYWKKKYMDLMEEMRGWV